jgi:hypothetical protein
LTTRFEKVTESAPFTTELQGIYFEGLLEAITRAIARIKRDAQAA